MAGTAKHRGFGHVRKLPSKRWQASYIGPDLARHTASRRSTPARMRRAGSTRSERLATTDTWTPPKVRGRSQPWPVDVRRVRRDLANRPRSETANRAHYRQLSTARSFRLSRSTDQGDNAGHGAYLALSHRRATPTTPSARYSLLRAILATAVGDEIIAANPCHIRGGGAAKRKVNIKPASLADLAKLVTAMPEKYRLMVLLAAWCALRFGELTELRRKDIDLKAGVIHVRRGVAWVDSKPVVGLPNPRPVCATLPSPRT